MQNNWKTMSDDIQVAQKILETHFKDNQENPMVIQKHTVTNEGNVTIERSAWVIDIEKTMIEKHGLEQGIKLTNKILSRFIIKEATIH
jgi:hypothetical protein